MTVFWTAVLLGLALFVAIVVAAHYRGQANAFGDAYSKVSSDVVALRQSIAGLASGPSSTDLSTVLSRLNAVATMVKVIVDDLRNPGAAAAPDTTAVTPPAAGTTSDAPSEPVAPAEAEAATPSAAEAGTESAPLDPLAQIDASIAEMKAKRAKVEAALKAKQDAETALREALGK